MPANFYDFDAAQQYIKLFARTSQDVSDDMTDPDTGLPYLLSYLFFFNTDNQEPEIITLGQRHPMLSKGQWDYVVDDAYTVRFSDTVPTLQEAITGDALNDPGVSIFVRSAGDVDAITIASTDSVQRIQGKDADTTVLPVAVTCNKANVTFEQLKVGDGITLATAGVDGTTFREVLMAGSGVLSLGASGISTLATVVDACRFEAVTEALVIGTRAGETVIRSCKFLDTATAISVAKVSTDTSSSRISIDNNLFDDFNSIPNAGFLIHNAEATVSCADWAITNNVLISNDGAIYLTCVRTLIAGNLILALPEGTETAVEVKSVAGTNIDTTIANNLFSGITGVQFSCTSADADAQGLMLIGNHFRGGTILGSQDAVWIGNNMAGCTINFQSKTGIVVLGGDMTGATLQNIPTDIVFRNVKGQADRGTYTGDIIPTTDSTYHLGSTALRWLDLWVDEIESGIWGLDLLPDGDNTRDLGSAGASWRDLFVDRNALVGGTLGVTGATTLSADATIRSLFANSDNVHSLGNLFGNYWAYLAAYSIYTKLGGTLYNPAMYVALPSTVQTLAAGTAILANAHTVQIQCTGVVVSTAAPVIANATFDGQIVIIVMTSGTTYTISDEGTVANSNVRLSTATFAMGPRDSLTLQYNAAAASWLEIGRSNVI